MREVIAYQCEFCGKLVSMRKGNAKRHERNCYKSPERENCYTCKNLISFVRLHDSDDWVTGYKAEPDYVYCKAGVRRDLSEADKTCGSYCKEETTSVVEE